MRATGYADKEAAASLEGLPLCLAFVVVAAIAPTGRLPTMDPAAPIPKATVHTLRDFLALEKGEEEALKFSIPWAAWAAWAACWLPVDRPRSSVNPNGFPELEQKGIFFLRVGFLCQEHIGLSFHGSAAAVSDVILLACVAVLLETKLLPAAHCAKRGAYASKDKLPTRGL